MTVTDTPTPDRQERSASPNLLRRPRIRVGAVIALAAAIGFVVWLVVESGGSSTKAQKSTSVGVSVSGLKTLAGALGQPVYWVGARPGVTYEVTQTPDGRTYVRYLPRGVKVGAPKPHLTIATYPFANAFAATNAVARQKGSIRVAVRGAAVAFYSKVHPTSVYVAYPHVGYQVEVFDPSPAAARHLVASGRVKPVSGTPAASAQATGAVAVTIPELRKLAAQLKQPIYWAGPRASTTYEYTRTPDGRIYLRYLPRGAKVGAQKPFLTIGTYPVRNAFAALQATARSKGSVPIAAGTGRVAFYSAKKPTSVYLARTGENFQVEVFDPSPARAHRLVASGRISPIR